MDWDLFHLSGGTCGSKAFNHCDMDVCLDHAGVGAEIQFME